MSEIKHMESTKSPSVDVEALAKRIGDSFPTLTERGQKIALAIYRALALGTPVPDYAVAASTGLQIQEVQAEMEGWPGVYRSDTGRIVGFWGLALTDMPHELVIEGTALTAWCAWDTLFLPELIGKPTEVRSTCATSGAPIDLLVSASGVTSRGATSEGDIVLSFVDPEQADVDGNKVISSFCHHILFFSTRTDGERWLDGRTDDAFLISLSEAFALAKATNASRFFDVGG
jgi:alkylmercury lyase